MCTIRERLIAARTYKLVVLNSDSIYPEGVYDAEASLGIGMVASSTTNRNPVGGAGQVGWNFH